MSIWFYLWLGLAGLVWLVWFIRLLAMGRILRKRQVLSSGSHSGPLASGFDTAPAPKVSVIVAAKDEEDNIESCVTSLLDQDYPNFEVIVVDDRSRDRTPSILRRIKNEAGERLHVVTVQSLRAGWFGKNNAMREGVAESSGDWLLFTDADCRQTSSRTISVAMGEAIDHRVDFLCITPVLESHTVWERIIQPVCTLVLMTWFLPHRVNKPKRKTAYANGAFMLLQRSCYEAIGGHESVRAEINEDIHMARLAKGMGLCLRVVENEDLYLTRMYSTPLAAWHGWSRIFFGSLGSLSRLGIAATLVMVLSILPWVSLLAALSARALGDAGTGTPWLVAVWAWLAVVAMKQMFAWRVYSMLRVRQAWSLTYILGAVVVFGMLINAMLKSLGATRTTWRGTTYRGNKLDPRPAATSGDGASSTKEIECSDSC